MKIGFFSSSTPITKISPKRFLRAKQFLEDKDIELVSGNLTGKVIFIDQAVLGSEPMKLIS